SLRSGRAPTGGNSYLFGRQAVAVPAQCPRQSQLPRGGGLPHSRLSSVGGYAQVARHGVAPRLVLDWRSTTYRSRYRRTYSTVLPTWRNPRKGPVLLARARQASARVTVPATALAQAIRRPERQA